MTTISGNGTIQAATKRPMRVNNVPDEGDLPVKTLVCVFVAIACLVTSLFWIGQSNQLDRNAPLAAQAAREERDNRIAMKAMLNRAATNLGY